MINFVRFKVIDGWEMGDAVSNVYNEDDIGVKFGKADWFTANTVGQEGDWVKDKATHMGHTWSNVTLDETLKKQIRRINGIPVIMLCFPNLIKTIANEHDTLKKIIDAFEPFPNVKFLFTNTWDLCSSNLHSFNIVDYILDRFKNIAGERINFILCNKHIVDEIKSKRPDIDSVYFNVYFDRVIHFNPSIEYNTNKRSKHFLCLNNLHKAHRFEIFNILPKDKSYKTYIEHGITLDNLDDCLEIQANFSQSELYAWQDCLPHKFYNDSYINVVNETMHEWYPFYDLTPNGHLTEKAFKPILFKQLFLINGYQNINHEMELLGFKLYNNFIDYSFDNIADPFVRMKKLIKEIKRLSNLDLEEIHNYMYSNEGQQIIEHNYNLYNDYRCNQTKRLTKKYGGDTNDIMSSGISF